MNAIETTYGIEVTHFLFSIGGEHFYGTAWKYMNDPERTSFSSDDPLDLFRHEIERPITSPKELAYLNKKDGTRLSFRHRKGDLTNRFKTPEDVIAAGVAKLTELYGDDICISKGDPFDIYEENKDNIIYNGKESVN